MATSKGMQARLAAKAAAVAGDGPGGDGDVSGGVGVDLDDEGTATTAGTPEASALGEAAAEGIATPAAAAAPEDAAKAARAKLYEEKFAQAREKRQAQRLAERAKADRRAAQADRNAAQAERAKYDGLKTGSFRDTLTALGRDPMKTFEELQREAIEASTPEAAARREKEEGARALEERFKPILTELEQLRAERAQWAARDHASNLNGAFQRAAADPAFNDLRVEYPDEVLLDHAAFYDKNPQAFRQAAHQYGVRLTSPQEGFTMHELLEVLSAAQAAHNSGVQARRAAQRPAEHQSAPPTVNGTAPRRNAAATGNEPAPERAATSNGEPAALSPAERMRQRARAEIRRSGG